MSRVSSHRKQLPDVFVLRRRTGHGEWQVRPGWSLGRAGCPSGWTRVRFASDPSHPVVVPDLDWTLSRSVADELARARNQAEAAVGHRARAEEGGLGIRLECRFCGAFEEHLGLTEDGRKQLAEAWVRKHWACRQAGPLRVDLVGGDRARRTA